MASLKQEPISLPNPPQISIATLSDPNPNSTSDPPMGVPLFTTPPTRRLPPPCWTPDETSTLIDSYRDKWYSLRRGNLRAAHWEDVANQIHFNSPNVTPPKTAIQCRHKMEKLRKRYRAELIRASSLPHHRFSSSWIYFSRMHAMENNNNNNFDANSQLSPATLPSPIPLSQSPSPVFLDSDTTLPTYSNPNYGHRSTFPQFKGARFVNGDELSGKKRKVESGGDGKGKGRREEGAREMVEAIRMVGEGFVKMETMKMEMMRETERIRMEMEMKRTEMLLQSQNRLVEAFAKGWAEVVNNGGNNNDDDE